MFESGFKRTCNVNFQPWDFQWNWNSYGYVIHLDGRIFCLVSSQNAEQKKLFIGIICNNSMHKLQKQQTITQFVQTLNEEKERALYRMRKWWDKKENVVKLPNYFDLYWIHPHARKNLVYRLFNIQREQPKDRERERARKQERGRASDIEMENKLTKSAK